MKPLKLVFLLMLVVSLSCCRPSPIESRPEEKELVGAYEAKLDDGRISLLEILDDRSVTGSFVPVRSLSSDKFDYRTIESSWMLVEPSMTPSGTWCIEFDGIFMQVYTEDSGMLFRYPYDVTRNRTLKYRLKHL